MDAKSRIVGEENFTFFLSVIENALLPRATEKK